MTKSDNQLYGMQKTKHDHRKGCHTKERVCIMLALSNLVSLHEVTNLGAKIGAQ